MKFLVLLVPLVLVVLSGQAYAQDVGPSVPNTPNTVSQYCSTGTCSTGSSPQIPVNYTHSNYHLPIIFVSLSQTCENMLKYNIPGCPTLDVIKQFDTSNQNISGKFIKQGNETIRTNPQVKSNWLYYAGKSNKTICIECTADITVMQQSQQIIIQPVGFTFIDTITNVTKGTWVSYSDRYMQGCDTATISNNLSLLNETIHYMLNGCLKTSFNGSSSHKMNNTPWQYDNPYSTLHQIQYLKSMLNGHTYNGNNTSGGNGPQDCIRHICNYSDPYKKVGW